MADKLNKLFGRIQASRYFWIAEAVAYAVMLILVLIFFTGNGQFLYEL